jgi:glutathione S-transferase
MLTLYQFKRTWGLPNLSHFCVKVETYLRMAGLDYDIVETLPLKAPKGKLPYIKDDDIAIADSRLILDYLENKADNKLDRHLSSEQQAVATSFTQLLEEHLYWFTMYTRWQYTDSNWRINKQAIFGPMAAPLRFVIAPVYRWLIKKQIHGQGTGRLSWDEIFTLGKADLDALANFLGDKPYFFGSKPCTLDASAFGILVNTLACPIESPLKDYALSKTNLRDYCQRIQLNYFPELAIERSQK